MKKYLGIIAWLLFTATVAVHSAPVEEFKGRQYPIRMTVVSSGFGIEQPDERVEVTVAAQ